MKNILRALAITFVVVSCGEKSSQQSEKQLIEEQEAVVADSIASELGAAKEELKADTQQNIEEIDSLLENF